MRFLVRWLTRLVVLIACIALVGVGAYYLLRPQDMQRTEIYRGVFLTVRDLPEGVDGSGKAMIVEAQWDSPGLRIRNRPFSYPVEANADESPQYDLSFADWSLFRDGAAVLVNTTAYHPSAQTDSLPGTPVRSVETVVADGQVSHVHEHSYLMYWDRSMDAHLLASKPPDPPSLSEALFGIGLQGVSVYDGEARLFTSDNVADHMSRTFIGFNPDTRTLYLLAFENASGALVIDTAIEAGATFGGLVDSGSATNLLVGSRAKGMLPHTGVRNLRPLGAYMEIFADPLEP